MIVLFAGCNFCVLVGCTKCKTSVPVAAENGLPFSDGAGGTEAKVQSEHVIASVSMNDQVTESRTVELGAFAGA